MQSPWPRLILDLRIHTLQDAMVGAFQYFVIESADISKFEH